MAESPIRTIVLDLTDLVAFVGQHRVFSGIQRVQIGLARAAMLSAQSILLATYVAELSCWRPIPVSLFQKIAALPDGNDADAEQVWHAVKDELARVIALSPALVFPRHAALANFGTAWSWPNYLLRVRELRHSVGLVHVQFVHDLVPIYAADTCVPGMTQTFIDWFLSALDSTDLLIANSQATLDNLIRAGQALSRALPRTALVLLDAVDPPCTAYSAELVPDEDYVLFVGTLEPRKNHRLAFSTWRSLVAERGVQGTPLLVCVGRKGWMYDVILTQAEDLALAGRVRLMQNVPDTQLSGLFRWALFSLTTSDHEGWGLPVTEALAHGKIPVVPRTAPFTEAAGDFGAYFTPGSEEDLLVLVRRLLDSADLRAAKERHIGANFRGRSWFDLWGGIVAEIEALPPSDPAVPTLPLKRFISMARNRHTALFADLRIGEVYRYGAGWRMPEDWGCLAEGRAALLFACPKPVTAARLYVRLRNPHDAAIEMVIESRGAMVRVIISAGEDHWLSLPLASPHPSVRVQFRGPPDKAFGLATLVLLEETDVKGRLDLLETLTLYP